MRATLMMQHQLALDGITNVYEDIFGLQKQITTGKKILTVSDDPAQTHQVLNVRKDISRNNSYLRAIDRSIPQVRLAQSALQQISDQLKEARTLAVGSINDATSTPDVLSNLAIQVDSMIDTVVSLSNSRNGNIYIFSGYNTTSETLTRDDAKNRIVFNGTDDQISIPIDNGGISQNVSTTGGLIFQTNKLRSTVGVTDPDAALNTQVAGINTDAFNITIGTDSTYSITEFDYAGGDSLNDLVAKINNIPGLNMRAYVKQLGNQYYIEFNSQVLGADGEIQLTDTESVLGAGDGLLKKLGIADVDSNIDATVVEDASGGALDTLIRIRDMFQSGKASAEEMGTYISSLDTALDKITKAHADVGTYEIRLEQTKSLKESLNIDLTQLKSNMEDVDFAYAASQIAVKQTAYQAAMNVATRILNLNILQYV